jgi:ribosomal protein S17
MSTKDVTQQKYQRRTREKLVQAYVDPALKRKLVDLAKRECRPLSRQIEFMLEKALKS